MESPRRSRPGAMSRMCCLRRHHEQRERAARMLPFLERFGVEEGKGRGNFMVIGDIMSTQLITVEPDDTLGHTASLFRQHQVHQLPVTNSICISRICWSPPLIHTTLAAPPCVWEPSIPRRSSAAWSRKALLLLQGTRLPEKWNIIFPSAREYPLKRGPSCVARLSSVFCLDGRLACRLRVDDQQRQAGCTQDTLGDTAHDPASRSTAPVGC